MAITFAILFDPSSNSRLAVSAIVQIGVGCVLSYVPFSKINSGKVFFVEFAKHELLRAAFQKLEEWPVEVYC